MKRTLLAAVVFLVPFLAFADDAPDLIIHHAKIFTADPAQRWAEAVAIRGNRIVAVGTNAEVTARAGTATRRIDAGGKLVVPGFNDAHTHQGPQPPGFAMSLDPDPTWALVSAGIGGATDESSGDLWIYGTIGPQLLADPAVTAQALDRASGHRKVVLQSWTGHGVIMSAAAMDALRIRETTPDPPGGWYERDANQRLTGKMFEYAGWNTLRRLADSVSDDEAVDAVQQYAAEALHYGITTFQNMSMLSLARYDKTLRHSNEPIRIRVIRFPMTENGRVNERTDLPATDRERPLSTISGTKWILDGTPVEQGAALREPYPGTTNSTGRLNFSPDEMKAIAQEAFKSTDQTLLHVAGDRTAAALFDAMKSVAPAAEWRKKRLRIEHGDGLLPDLLATAKDLGVVVVINPTHVMAVKLYPPGGFMPAKSLLRSAIPIAIGSDGPMNPGLNIQLATTMPGNTAEALTREEAVEAYTQGGAYAEGMENEKGTIAAGKLADLAMLSQDIFKVSAEQLPETISVMTIVNGRIVSSGGTVRH
jgi:predicted amidohydrolase YtcJ